MKTIGIIGGMSWESTLQYYRSINQHTRAALGGLHSAKILLYSVDFAPIEKLQQAGDWDAAALLLTKAAQSLQAGGADFFLIATNTMHKVAQTVASSVQIPLLHIADATAQALGADGVQRVGLLGTAFTMQQDFYRKRIAETLNIEVLVPTASDQKIVHQVIYQELCLGQVHAESKRQYLAIINRLVERGAQGVILGCTEISLLIAPADTSVKLYDTTELHARAAVEFALAD